MRKYIFTIILFVSLFFSGLSAPAYSSGCISNSDQMTYSLNDPVEVWREYVLVGDQWYLIIHYDDGSIGAIPVAKPVYD